MADSKKLRRSDNPMIAGICGGIAEYLDVPPTRVRVAYVILSALSVGFPGLLLYLVLWFVLPRSRSRSRLNDFRAQ